jgi:hypothetical protein
MLVPSATICGTARQRRPCRLSGRHINRGAVRNGRLLAGAGRTKRGFEFFRRLALRRGRVCAAQR